MAQTAKTPVATIQIVANAELYLTAANIEIMVRLRADRRSENTLRRFRRLYLGCSYLGGSGSLRKGRLMVRPLLGCWWLQACYRGQPYLIGRVCWFASHPPT